jgi:hypothetical protein
MPALLRISCFIAIAATVALAVLAPFYETGIFRYTTPLLCLGAAACVGGFLLRKPWAWRWIQSLSFFIPLISLLFPPTAEFYGQYTSLAMALYTIEGAAFVTILAHLLRSQATKQWFAAAP